MNAISRVIKEKMNVSETEKYIAELLGAENEKEKKPAETKRSVVLTADLVCSNIDRYVEKLRSVSDLVTVDKKEVGTDMVITLTVKRGVS